jgi:hypothetical protein
METFSHSEDVLKHCAPVFFFSFLVKLAWPLQWLQGSGDLREYDALGKQCNKYQVHSLSVFLKKKQEEKRKTTRFMKQLAILTADGAAGKRQGAS